MITASQGKLTRQQEGSKLPQRPEGALREGTLPEAALSKACSHDEATGEVLKVQLTIQVTHSTPMQHHTEEAKRKHSSHGVF